MVLYDTQHALHTKRWCAVKIRHTSLLRKGQKLWTFNRDDVRVPYKGGAPHGGKKWATSGESLSRYMAEKKI